MADVPVITDNSNRILTLRLNRPERKNALTGAMYQALADALAAAETDPEVRCVLLTGSGDSFTSGNDIQDFLKRPPSGETSPAAAFMQALRDFEKPVVASVNGVAVGIGVTLLLHCDLVFASKDARFQMPFVNLGIVQEFGSSVLLPAVMGHARAAELLLLGEMFDAQKALAYGLVNALSDGDALQATAQRACQRLAAQPPSAVREAKKLLRRQDRPLVVDAMEAEAQKFLPMLGGPEAIEAMTAFMQKRAPDFSKFN